MESRDVYSLNHERMFKMDVKNSIIIPGLLVGLLIPIFNAILSKISGHFGGLTGICITVPAFLLFYAVLLVTVKVIRKSDFA